MAARSHELICFTYSPRVAFAVVGWSVGVTSSRRALCQLGAAYINHSSVLWVALSRADLRAIFHSHVPWFTKDTWCSELIIYRMKITAEKIAECVKRVARLAVGDAYTIRGLCIWCLNILNYTMLAQRTNGTKRGRKKYTVIPRLTRIIRSGIIFVSRNVISRRFL